MSLSPPTATACTHLRDGPGDVLARRYRIVECVGKGGLRAAKAKGRSPHWMWLGIHPVSGWIAFVWLRYFARPFVPPAAGPAARPAAGVLGDAYRDRPIADT